MIDIATGNVLYNNKMKLNDPLDNVFSIKYDNKHGRLYSIHWDNTITDNSSDYADFISSIFPNPMIEGATLEFNNPFRQSCTFRLYDALGKLVQEVSGITGGYVDIKRSDLAAGVYFYQLRSPTYVYATGKLVMY